MCISYFCNTDWKTLGRSRARNWERNAIEAAATVLADEEGRLGITHAGFAMTSLPHKRIEEGLWRREGNRTTLLVELRLEPQWGSCWSALRLNSSADLLNLQTEAVPTNCPEVELGRSMKSWMSRMSLTSGGKTYQLVAVVSAADFRMPANVLYRP